MKTIRRGVLVAGFLAAAAAATGYGMEIGQPRERPVVIGIIHLSPVDIRTFEGFKAAMAARGYREGEGTRYLYSGPAGDVSRLPGIVAAQLAEGVDLLVASSTPAALTAAKAASQANIPVIFAPVNDPVAARIVDSLARPGGQVTGVKLPAGDDLRLLWLTRIAPDVRHVFVPYNPADPSALTSVGVITAAATQLGVTLHLQAVATRAALSASLAALPDDVQAVFLPRDSMVEGAIEEVVAHANRRRMPVSAPSHQQVEQGALFAFGFSHREIGERAARLATHVLNGVSAGNIPVESAESTLIINLQAADAIGRHVPDEILALADIVLRGQ